MELFMVTLLLLISTGAVSTTKLSQQYRLFSNITKGYNPEIIPNDESMDINVSFTFYSFKEVDEVSGSIDVSGYFTVSWYDSMVKWDPDAYGGVTELNINGDSLWKPDLMIMNFHGQLHPLTDNSVKLNVRNDGHVIWYPGSTYSTTCAFDATEFPFDRQTCFIRLGSWTYTYPRLNISLVWPLLTKSNNAYDGNGDWKLNGMSTEELIWRLTDNTRWKSLMFHFYIARRPISFIINTAVPVIVLMFLNVFVFKVPVASGERLSYAITVVLSFAVFSSMIISATANSAKTLSILCVYLTMVTTMSSVIVLLTVLNLSIYHCENSFPKWLRISTKTFCPTENLDITKWKELSAKLDTMFFRTLISFIVMMNIGFGIVYYLRSINRAT